MLHLGLSILKYMCVYLMVKMDRIGILIITLSVLWSSVQSQICLDGSQALRYPNGNLFVCEIPTPGLAECPTGYSCDLLLQGSDVRGICCIEQACPAGSQVVVDPVTQQALKCPEDCGPPCVNLGLDYETCCGPPGCPGPGGGPETDSLHITPLECPGECKSQDVFCNDGGRAGHKVCCPVPVCPDGRQALNASNLGDGYLCDDRRPCPGGYLCIVLDKLSLCCPRDSIGKCPDGSTPPNVLNNTVGLQQFHCEGATDTNACNEGLSCTLLAGTDGRYGCCKTPPCDQPIKIGPCRAEIPRWAFQNGQCVQFKWGGCQPNGNNFLTQQDCENACKACEQPIKIGPCKARLPRWAFQNGQCVQFKWGGCQPNGNNFLTQQDCENTCKVAVCNLPLIQGPCKAYFPSWGYNTYSGQCEQFIYGGCNGNANRFETEEECEKVCPRKAEEPEDVCPDGNFPYDNTTNPGYQVFFCNVFGNPNSVCPNGYSCIPRPGVPVDLGGICCLDNLCPGGNVLKDMVTYVPLECPKQCDTNFYVCTDIGLDYEVCCKTKKYECPYTGLPPQLSITNQPLPCPEKCTGPAFCADIGLDKQVCCPPPVCPNGNTPLTDPSFIDNYFMYSCDRPGCPAGYDCIPQSVWGTRKSENAICCPSDGCDHCELEKKVGFYDFNEEECCFNWAMNATCTGCCESSSSDIWILGQKPKTVKDCRCCLPFGEFERCEGWKICLHGPGLTQDEVCKLPGLTHPWFTCETFIYQIPKKCKCQDCDSQIEYSSVETYSAECGEQPSPELLAIQSNKFILGQKKRMEALLKSMDKMNGFP